MIYSIDEIRARVKPVAEQFDIEEILLFGSYFDGLATENSDLDFVVRYGDGCRGLTCIGFMNALEAALEKKVDVINVEFPPRFMKRMDMQDERRRIYGKQSNWIS